ncbi:MAG: HIRAN domain-containing protein [Phycisphaerales bacterium]|nr:HIRAN domain-containing protein [Phycisphaerales bacterium]
MMTNQSIFIAWRGGGESDGQWGPVGRLDRVTDDYRFVYTRGAKTLPGFSPFPGMDDLNKVYQSDNLFPLFANRLLAKSRPEYEAFLRWGGFDGFDRNNPPDPIALLGVTEGRRATDSLEVFICPQPDTDGCFINKFFLHGVRHISPSAIERLNRLNVGDPLGLVAESQNPHDSNAVAVQICDDHDRIQIGYVPRYLARDINALIRQCHPEYIRLTVERVNTDAPLQQRLLCRMNACWPQGYRPCTDEAFKPLPVISSPAVPPLLSCP